VIEVLSRRYHGSLTDQRADLDRVEELRRAGFDVMTVWDTDVWNNAETVRDRILAFSRADLGL
jgi:very-short-patch-repair endonuclease